MYDTKLVKWKISGWFPSHPRNPIRENINSIDNPRHHFFLKNNFTGNFSQNFHKRSLHQTQ